MPHVTKLLPDKRRVSHTTWPLASDATSGCGTCQVTILMSGANVNIKILYQNLTLSSATAPTVSWPPLAARFENKLDTALLYCL